ncbi:MAG: DUF4430 domain-containing protein [Steroidobacteraceae bacterium]
MPNIVMINIYSAPGASRPTHQLPHVPWFAGITALQAMVLGEAMYEKSFSFRVVYRSIYGAFIDCIDDVADDPERHCFWMLYINGTEAQIGASEAIIQEDEVVTSASIDWRYEDVSKGIHRQALLRAKTLPAAR